MVRRSLGFFAYLAQARFAEALAQLPLNAWPSTGWQQMACYRLGMYGTVAQSAWDGKHLQGGMAVAVSLAGCGEHDRATQMVHDLVAHHGPGRYQSTLADALAPFMPRLALSLVNHGHAPVALRTALLLRTGEREQAARLIQEARSNSKVHTSPELLLLQTNALEDSPEEELERMNAFLARFSLPPLALRDETLPPSTGNLMPAQRLPPVNGPLVSVLMTAYNTAGRIGAALEGLRAQTWRNLEVVVVDDCSTDDTAEVVHAIADQDSRIKYIRMACNAGTYVAKTVGLQQAKGEFVTCHDSDDWSHPLRLERQMLPLLNNRRLVATTSQWVRIEDNGTFYARPVHPLMRLNPASPLFRRREVVSHAGLWDAVRTGADSEFHGRLLLVFGRQSVRRVVQPLTFGAHRADSLMNAASTGYSEVGLAPHRLTYGEAWTRWHIAELHAGRKPVMPDIGSSTPALFECSPGVRIPREMVLTNLSATRLC
jgi:hypothetical protein